MTKRVDAAGRVVRTPTPLTLTKHERQLVLNYRRENKDSWHELITEARMRASGDHVTQGTARRIRADISAMVELMNSGADYATHEQDFGWY